MKNTNSKYTGGGTRFMGHDTMALTRESTRALDNVIMGRHFGSLSLFVTVVTQCKLRGVSVSDATAAMWVQRADDLESLRGWDRCTESDVETHRAITQDVSAMLLDVQIGAVDMDVALDRAAGELATRGRR